VEEGVWLTSADPQALLAHLRGVGDLSERKLRLFVAACARSLRPTFGDGQEAVAVIHERHADGQASDHELIRFMTGEMFDRLYPGGVIPVGHSLLPVAESAAVAGKTATDFASPASPDGTGAGGGGVCGLLRCIFGNPFRPVAADTAWLTPDVVAVATGIYDGRAFDRLPILADALLDAGCTSEDIMGHLRSGGCHVRGCWPLDLILGRP
jgi:hypothetical protein